MPIWLSTSAPEASPTHKAVINASVVCGSFSVLGYFVVFSESNLFLGQASTLDYVLAFEPLFSLLVLMLGVRIGWVDWKKDHYDHMKFPLSGIELLTLVGFVSAFCLFQLLDLPILPVASGVSWTTYAFICSVAIPGLIWASRQDKAAWGKIRIWSAIWRALMMFVIAAEMFLILNMLSAERTERMVLGYIESKYSTTGSRGVGHYYHVDVTSPIYTNGIVSMTIDRANWAQIRKGDAIKLRLFRGGLRQDYWRYEH